jgi:hypothetical protein
VIFIFLIAPNTNKKRGDGGKDFDRYGGGGVDGDDDVIRMILK